MRQLISDFNVSTNFARHTLREGHQWAGCVPTWESGVGFNLKFYAHFHNFFFKFNFMSDANEDDAGHKTRYFSSTYAWIFTVDMDVFLFFF